MAELIYPDAGQWINALEAGQQAGMTQRRNAAATSAGGKMSAGDYQGAAADLYGAGDIQSGVAISRIGADQATQAHKLARQQAVQQKLAAGDIAGAYEDAGADPELIGALDKVAAHSKETTATLAGALQALKDPATGQWLPPELARARYQEIKPTLQARGIDPRMLDGFDPTPANLEAIQGQVLGLQEQLKMAAPKVVGKSLVTPQGKPLYTDPTYEKVGADETLIEVGAGGGGDGAPGASGGGGAGAGPAAEAPVPTGGIYAQVGQLAAAKGAQQPEVDYLKRLAQVESHGDPAAQNGRSTGLFQFHPDTFAGVGGHNINDVGDQTQAALALQRRDRASLHSLGIEPTDANAYIMHQQGPGGGRALLTAPPEVNAVAALAPVYGNQKMAERAIVGNGGTPDMTAGEFVDMWRKRWANGGAPVQAGAGVSGAGGAGGALPGGAKVLFTGAAKGGGEDDINDSAIKLQASKYLQTGVVPPFGMGRAGTTARNKFYNEAAKQADELHLSSADLVSGAYTTKALGASMTQMQKSLEATQSYEKTALANGELMLSLAPKGGGQTGIPVLNRWLQAGRKQIAGDPDVTKFDNAIGAFSEEYAKVMTGNLGNVAATDGARKDASERLAKYAAQDQLTQGYDVMKQEMENRNHAQEAQVAGIQAKLRAGITPGSPQDTPGAAPPPPKANPQASWTAPQQAAAKKADANATPGSQGNPFVPTTEAQYKKLPKGAHYIFTDGRVMVKGG
jgi:hypothetical protein